MSPYAKPTRAGRRGFLPDRGPPAHTLPRLSVAHRLATRKVTRIVPSGLKLVPSGWFPYDDSAHPVVSLGLGASARPTTT
jgi:hypothetical protein